MGRKAVVRRRRNAGRWRAGKGEEEKEEGWEQVHKESKKQTGTPWMVTLQL